jgi:hypothetical protein
MSRQSNRATIQTHKAKEAAESVALQRKQQEESEASEASEASEDSEAGYESGEPEKSRKRSRKGALLRKPCPAKATRPRKNSAVQAQEHIVPAGLKFPLHDRVPGGFEAGIYFKTAMPSEGAYFDDLFKFRQDK